MILIPGIPQRPEYSSVKAYLLDLAKDVAMLVDETTIMKLFREQLHSFNKICTDWITADEADRQGCWEPSMGKPEYPWNVFSRTYNVYIYDNEKEAKVLSGSYSLLTFIHDRELPHLEKINDGIVSSSEVIELTLAAPRNQLESRIIDNRTAGEDVSEIYLVEEHYNRVKVDIQERVASSTVESKADKIRKAKEIDQVVKLSNVKLFEYVANVFRKRELKALGKEETWLSFDRSLNHWFEIAIERLKQVGKEDKIGLLQYEYKNLLHFARGINIKNFRGFPDSSIAASLLMSSGDHLSI